MAEPQLPKPGEKHWAGKLNAYLTRLTALVKGAVQRPELDAYAKKSDLPDTSTLATKHDLEQYAKTADVPDVSTLAAKSDLPDVTKLATKDELAGYAKKSELPDAAKLATKHDLDAYAKKTEIPDPKDLATKHDLDAYVKKVALGPYAKAVDVSRNFTALTNLSKRVKALEDGHHNQPPDKTKLVVDPHEDTRYTTETEFVVYWTTLTGLDTSKADHGYMISIHPAGGGPHIGNVTVDGSTTQVKVTGCKPGATYVLKIKALAAAGKGTDSDQTPVTVTTKPEQKHE